MMELTPTEWCKLYGVRIMDPDGWRMENAPHWHDAITQQDFEFRLGISTISVVDNDLFDLMYYKK